MSLNDSLSTPNSLFGLFPNGSSELKDRSTEENPSGVSFSKFVRELRLQEQQRDEKNEAFAKPFRPTKRPEPARPHHLDQKTTGPKSADPNRNLITALRSASPVSEAADREPNARNGGIAENRTNVESKPLQEHDSETVPNGSAASVSELKQDISENAEGLSEENPPAISVDQEPTDPFSMTGNHRLSEGLLEVINFSATKESQRPEDVLFQFEVETVAGSLPPSGLIELIEGSIQKLFAGTTEGDIDQNSLNLENPELGTTDQSSEIQVSPGVSLADLLINAIHPDEQSSAGKTGEVGIEDLQQLDARLADLVSGALVDLQIQPEAVELESPETTDSSSQTSDSTSLNQPDLANNHSDSETGISGQAVIEKTFTDVPVTTTNQTANNSGTSHSQNATFTPENLGPAETNQPVKIEHRESKKAEPTPSESQPEVSTAGLNQVLQSAAVSQNSPAVTLPQPVLGSEVVAGTEAVSKKDQVSETDRVLPNDANVSHSKAKGADSATLKSQGIRQTTSAEADAFKNAQRIADSVRQAHQQGRTLKMRLNPPELGTLQIEVSSRDGQVTARLEVQTVSARQAILNQLSSLRDSLIHHGITLDRIDVQLSQDLYDESSADASWEGEANEYSSQDDQGQQSDEQTDSDTENTTGPEEKLSEEKLAEDQAQETVTTNTIINEMDIQV